MIPKLCKFLRKNNEIQEGFFNDSLLDESIKKHPAWFRLNDQLNWYDKKSQYSQKWYKRLKIFQVLFAILIPIAVFLPDDWTKWFTSVAGVLIALLEAVQQMNQYSTLWFSYRVTAEYLKHEKYLFLSCAGPYKAHTEEERLVILAERVEEHVSTEHANWFNEVRRSSNKQGESK